MSVAHTVSDCLFFFIFLIVFRYADRNKFVKILADNLKQSPAVKAETRYNGEQVVLQREIPASIRKNAVSISSRTVSLLYAAKGSDNIFSSLRRWEMSMA